VGGAIGLAVLATVAAERTTDRLAAGDAAAAALNSGYHLAYLIGAVLLAAALGVSLAVFRTPKETATPEPAHVPAFAEVD